MPSKFPLIKLLVFPLAAVIVANVVWFVASAFIEASQQPDPEAPVVYRGARIHTASGPVIERGVMIVLKGKILDVGSEDQVKIPNGAKVHDMTGKYGPRLVKKERCDYLRPTVAFCESPAAAIAKKEFMFPFATVVQCPQEKMIEAIGPTLVCSAVTEDAKFQRALLDAVHIDRLNIGALPTIKLNWLQPHEGNIVDFLFRARAFQSAGS